MTRGGDVTCNSVSKALSADSISVVELGRAFSAVLLRAWNWMTRHSRSVLTRGVPRRLKVAETVSLGEKRFISILQVDGEQFLLGGSPSNIILLAKLESKPEDPGARSFDSVFSHVESGIGRGETDSKSPTEVLR